MKIFLLLMRNPLTLLRTTARVILRAMVPTALLCGMGIASVQAAPTIPWPAGWEVGNGPPLTNSSGEAVQGSQVIATKRGPPGILAAISVWTLARPANSPERLQEGLRALINATVENNKKQGLGTRCTPVAQTRAGGLPALSAGCDTSRSKDGVQTMRQIITMTSSKSAIYVLTYYAAPRSFDTYKGNFDALSQHIQLP
ncbi:MAG: DUF4946 domain-containing protein [Burkholderiaceae bacterium]|jgi:hypothetical protein|nr:DUF4946 domain-containing protein [Burkholderiaceae bacterium]